MKIYLAGKIARSDWRHELIADLEYTNARIEHNGHDHDPGELVGPWPILQGVLPNGDDYTGPYFIGGGHGQGHGPHQHGVWACDIDQRTVIEACYDAIRASDVVFAWVDDLTAYGTLVEIGIARATGRFVIFAAPEWVNDLWFAASASDRVVYAPTALEAYHTAFPPPAPPPAPTPKAQPKAIETEYNGYKFRSRLEARWAVFFDSLGVQYEYEKEGFKLEHGWYLPDFWLPDLDVWVEIKPDMNKWNDDAWTKCNDLATASGKLVLLSSGSPWPDEYFLMDFRAFDPKEGYGMTEGAWAQCRKCDGVCIVEHTNGWFPLGPHTCGKNEKWPLVDDFAPKLKAAYKAARQARFEHGAKG